MSLAPRNIELSPIRLISNSVGKPVDAELWDAITEKNLADWEAEWIPALHVYLKELNGAGVDRTLWPQSRHWDWRKKAVVIEGLLSNQCMSIVCDGMTQAMMIMDLTKRARINTQATGHLVYIDFLEAAPWNRQELNNKNKLVGYSGCGSILIRAAIEFSKAEGFKGRIGLHSLPQSNAFYANRVGMTDLGKDSSYENLRYFEMTPDQAEAFLKGGVK